MLHVAVLFVLMSFSIVDCFVTQFKKFSTSACAPFQINSNHHIKPSGQLLIGRRQPLHDLLGLGPAEIAVTVIVALVLFGPETLKSLSRDVGKAAAELKEIPKTFKEGMEEGSKSSQSEKLKAIAAQKRKKRDEKLASAQAEAIDDGSEGEAD